MYGFHNGFRDYFQFFQFNRLDMWNHFLRERKSSSPFLMFFLTALRLQMPETSIKPEITSLLCSEWRLFGGLFSKAQRCIRRHFVSDVDHVTFVLTSPPSRGNLLDFSRRETPAAASQGVLAIQGLRQRLEAARALGDARRARGAGAPPSAHTDPPINTKEGLGNRNPNPLVIVQEIRA